jgi:hypothetical protein
MAIKYCPFNGNPCTNECALYDSEINSCEFKDKSQFMSECITELTDVLIDKLD